MSVIEMCFYYGYDLAKRKPTCDRKHQASLKCHSTRKDCSDYISTGNKAERAERYRQFIEG